MLQQLVGNDSVVKRMLACKPTLTFSMTLVQSRRLKMINLFLNHYMGESYGVRCINLPSTFEIPLQSCRMFKRSMPIKIHAESFSLCNTRCLPRDMDSWEMDCYRYPLVTKSSDFSISRLRWVIPFRFSARIVMEWLFPAFSQLPPLLPCI